MATKGVEAVRAFCLFVAVGLASITTHANAQTWAEYRPKVGYSLEMPGEWSITAQDVPTAIGAVKTQIATVDLGSTVYITMYAPYPSEKVRGKPVTSILDGARDGIISSTHATLKKEERLIVNNLPARQITVETPDHTVMVDRFLMLDNYLIQALVAGSQGVELQPNTKRFVESLKVDPER